MQKNLMSAIAVTCLAIAASACGGEEKAPVQDATIITVQSKTGKTMAFGWSASTGYNVVQVNPGDTVKYVGKRAQALSARLGGTSGFSASVAGNSTFRGQVAASTGFSARTPASSQFTATVGGSCNLAALCTLADRLCEAVAGLSGEGGDACDSFSVGECYAAVSRPEALSAINQSLAEVPELGALVCLIVDFVDCVLSSSSGLMVSEDTAMQCASNLGFGELGNSDDDFGDDVGNDLGPGF